jgi:hypothetical protein
LLLQGLAPRQLAFALGRRRVGHRLWRCSASRGFRRTTLADV